MKAHKTDRRIDKRRSRQRDATITEQARIIAEQADTIKDLRSRISSMTRQQVNVLMLDPQISDQERQELCAILKKHFTTSKRRLVMIEPFNIPSEITPAPENRKRSGEFLLP